MSLRQEIDPTIGANLREEFNSASQGVSLKEYRLNEQLKKALANGSGQEFAKKLIDAARDNLDSLEKNDRYAPTLDRKSVSGLVEEIHLFIEKANLAEGWSNKGPNKKYDLWVLDKTWDTDPTNAKGSNAVMTNRLAKAVDGANERYDDRERYGRANFGLNLEFNN